MSIGEEQELEAVSGGASAGAVASAPRGGSWRRDLAPRLLVVLAVLAVFLPLVLHPSELIYAPRSDLLAFIHPYRVLQNQSLRELGRLTLYDPTSFGGRPLIGDPQAGVFYPPNWLHLLDRGGEGEAFHGWLIVLHLLAGGLGMLWWGRLLGLSAPSRLAAALVFMLFGKWFHHIVAQGHVIFLPVMWLPWQCGLLLRLSQRVTPRRVALLASVTALVLLGCQPQLVLYSQALVAGCALFAVFDRATRRASSGTFLAAVGAAFLLAFGLAAISLLPILADLDLYVRGAGLDYATAAARAIEPRQLSSLLLPLRVPELQEPPPYAGVVALPLALLAILGRTRRRLALFAASALLFICWYGLGAAGGLHRLLFELVPGFDLFRIPSRVFLLLGLPLGLLLAIGLDAACAAPASAAPRERWLRRGLALGLAALGAAGALRGGDVEAVLLACGFALPALLLLPPWSPGLRRGLPWLVAALVFADVARVAAPQVETRPLEAVLGDNPVARRIAAPLGEGRVLAFNFRSRGDLSVLPASYVARAGLESLRGFNPLLPSASYEYLMRGAAGSLPEARPRVTIPTFAIASRPHLDLFNVRWLALNHPVQIEGLELRERFGPIDVFHYQLKTHTTTIAETFLYENTRVFPRAALVRSARFVPDRAAAIAAIGSFDPHREVLVDEPGLAHGHPGEFEPVAVEHRGDELSLEVDAGQGGFLVLSELHYPGWRVWDGDEPLKLHTANGIFQLVELSAGSHALRFRYLPAAYQTGRWLSLGSLLIVLVCLKFD